MDFNKKKLSNITGQNLPAKFLVFIKWSKMNFIKNGWCNIFEGLYSKTILLYLFLFTCTCLLVFLLFPHFSTEVDSLGKGQIFSNLSCFRVVEWSISVDLKYLLKLDQKLLLAHCILLTWKLKGLRTNPLLSILLKWLDSCSAKIDSVLSLSWETDAVCFTRNGTSWIWT